jgi:hypothetical protein
MTRRLQFVHQFPVKLHATMQKHSPPANHRFGHEVVATMSRRLPVLLLIACGLCAAPFLVPAARAEAPLTVLVDQATVLRLPENVGTIVVGNPLIADVSLQAGGMMVVIGKGYGATNLLVLDRQGATLIDRMVRVEGPRENVVTVYRGIDRETYSCLPRCERRITLGDSPEYFSTTLGQAANRTASAQGAPPLTSAQPAAPAPPSVGR